MSDYTPTVKDVRDIYVNERVFVSCNIALSVAEAGAEFDRWLTALLDEALVKSAEIAWTRAVDHLEPFLPPTIKRAAHADNPYEVIRKEEPKQ